MIVRIAALCAVLLPGLAFADDETSRAKLAGSWQVADGGKDAAIWTLSEKGDTVHLTNSAGGRIQLEFDCDTLGHECAIKDAGRPAKVTVWHDGPKLVVMETRGANVSKRTFGVTGNGDTMDLEVAQIAPGPKNETQHFKRLAAAPASH